MHSHDHSQHASHDQDRAHAVHAGHDPQVFRRRFWVSLILTLPVLYFSEQFQEWFGYTALVFPGVEWVNPVLATVLFFYGGGVFLQGSARELRTGGPGMMTLIALAITVAFIYSLAISFGLSGMPFYWELATLITIMLLGHWIEMATVQQAGQALQSLADLVPTVAHRKEGESWRDVKPSELRPGDLILIRPGEQVPADGTVKEGHSSANEAFLTGESRPVAKSPGEVVIAGSVNGEGALQVKLAKTGDQTTVSQMMRLVEEAQSSRSRFQGLADRAAGWLFYIALVAGIVTFAGWLLGGGELNFALTRAVTVLVIACPHALGLAIPLVLANATGIAARHGVLVRNREAFDRGREIRTVAFDKTGTLTEGRFGVVEVATEGMNEDQALAIAAGLEQSSEHSLAAAIVSSAQKRGLNLPEVSDFQVVAGRGVSGSVGGRNYRVGQPEWGGELAPELSQAITKAESQGYSTVVLAEDDRIRAVIALADQIRSQTPAAIQEIKKMGLQPVMITGDAEAVAEQVARAIGIERYYARVLPGKKQELVRELQKSGPVAFVGDGINDAPALLAADLGIAVGAGTNVAIESADLVLAQSDPLAVAGVLRLTRATYGKFIQNLAWATGYNVVAIPLAAGAAAGAGILLSPAVGAVLMSVSTVIVAINAMTLRRVAIGPAGSPAQP